MGVGKREDSPKRESECSSARTLLNFLNVAISPCPNDTFAFEAWITGVFAPNVEYHDIETLNKIAISEALFDVTKISTACVADVMENYIILPVGAAFAAHEGPFLVTRREGVIRNLAVPGIHTSAFAAYTLLHEHPQEIREMSYEKIVAAVLSGECDAGILIHEAQNRASTYGFVVLDDLGKSFQNKFLMQLPLGVIVAKRSLGKKILDDISKTLFLSIQEAKKRNKISSFVKEKAQEKDDGCLTKHIQAFVTEDTELLRLHAEIKKFLSLVGEAGLTKRPSSEELIHEWNP
jgi:1,4-dihydroxy-6-naphthoate synthase